MKRFHVFGYESYYPGGGWSDHIGSYNTADEAITYADSVEKKWSGGIEVIDLETEEDIYIYPRYREPVS